MVTRTLTVTQAVECDGWRFHCQHKNVKGENDYVMEAQRHVNY